MITYQGFKLAAPPRCGAGWFMDAAAEIGWFGQRYSNRQMVLLPPPRYEPGLVISLVRHPYDWLMSLYRSQQQAIIHPPIDLLIYLAGQSATPAEFIRQYLARCPGMVGFAFETYYASTVLRLEDFPQAPLELFESLGATARQLFEAKQTPPSRVSSPYPIDRDLRREVERAECEFCARYNY